MHPYFDLESLYLFSKILEEKSFSAVSRKTRIPKASLSRKIKDLEEQMGAQLLIRTTRHVHATDLGREFLQRVNTILATAEDAKNLVQKTQEEPQGLIRITAGVEFGLSVLTPLILKYQELYPKIEIELDLTGRFVDLAYEGFDMGIRIGPLEDSNLNCRKIGSFSYGLFVSPMFLKKYGPIKTIHDIHQIPQLAFSRANQKIEWKLINGMKAENLTIKPKIISNNYWVIEKAALSGKGIAFMPKFLVKESIEKRKLVPVLNHWQSVEIPIHIVYPPQRFISSKLRTFIDFIVNSLKPVYFSPGNF